MATVTKPVALNESLNTTDSTPKNIADVLKDKLGDIASAISGGGGGSGGHTIQNASGTNMPQEPTMQFTDSHVSDDSTNEKTVIENIKSVTEAQFESATEDGLYDVDVEGAEIGEISEDYVEVTADGDKTWATLINEIYNDLDFSKIKDNSYIITDGNDYQILRLDYVYGNSAIFTNNIVATNVNRTISITVSSNSERWVDNNGTITNSSSNKPTKDTVITLYYGTDKAVVDLQTTANRCLMSNGESVENRLKDSGWQTSSAVNGNVVQYRKIGNQVWVRRYTTGTIPANTLTTIANLPNGYKPTLNVQVAVVIEASLYGEVVVTNNGEVKYMSNVANTMGAFCISYLID